MKEVMIFEKDELLKFFYNFVESWIRYQDKNWGHKVYTNETGDLITDRDTLRGIFYLRWQEALSKMKERG